MGDVAQTIVDGLKNAGLMAYEVWWALVLGFAVFGAVPSLLVFLGAGIVAAAGLFVIWRERQLGLQRARAKEGPPTGT